MSMLDKLAALDAAATPGPWHNPPETGKINGPDRPVVYGLVHGADADLIAELRTALPAILAALRAAEDVKLRASLAAEVAAEGERAKALHGEPADRPGRDWLAILAEEFGEVAMEVTKGEVPPVNRDRQTYLTNLRAELVQVASVAMRWLAATDAALDQPEGNKG